MIAPDAPDAPDAPAPLERLFPLSANHMKTTLSRFLVPTAVIVLACAATLQAGLESKQPREELARQYLEDALKAEDPAPLLHKAKDELEKVKGVGEKAEYRDRAIAIIDTGLDDLKGGKKEKVSGDITTAIASIQSSMSHARGRR